MTAVMVDLGWAWWVSSAIALSIAAGSLAAFVTVRRPFVRGVAATLAVQGVAIALLAPFLMDDDGETTTAAMSGSAMEGGGAAASASATRAMPYTFFFTRYASVGDTGIRYISDGTPLAKAPDGATLTLSGSGGWDPVRESAAGEGRYEITDGGTTTSGRWRVVRLVSFLQLPGWLPAGTREEGWQGPPGSASFSGVLELDVRLDGRGEARLRAWCMMSDTSKKATGYAWDGITLVGNGLAFTEYRPNEGRAEGGVMFYGPGSG